MKKILFIILFYSFNVSAQKAGPIDSIYYFIDTEKVDANAHIWDIHIEYPSIKIYSIQCHCLQYNQNPTFAYNINVAKAQFVTSQKLKKIKFTNIKALISKSKQISDPEFKGKYAIFIVEQKNKKYFYHEVRLIKPMKPRNKINDYEVVRPGDSTSLKKP